MEEQEEKALPRRCKDCQERKAAERIGLSPDAYCYNCDYELERFGEEETEDLMKKLREFRLRRLLNEMGDDSAPR